MRIQTQSFEFIKYCRLVKYVIILLYQNIIATSLISPIFVIAQLRINQFQAMDTNSRSRLSSITEEQHDPDHPSKTVHELMHVYYELYAINYVSMPVEPANVFQTLSANIQSSNPSLYAQFTPFNEKRAQVEAQKLVDYFKQSMKQPTQKGRILSKQELSQRIKQKLSQSPGMKMQKHEQFVQTVAQNKRQPKQLEDTADSKTSISQILDRLNQFDEERTQIKLEIYAEDSGKVDHLYLRWSDLHRRMKEVLEIYINKIGNGKSLLEIYKQMNKFKGTKNMIEGFTQMQLLSKLDIYIQSLFLDEREILLYRNSSEKSRAILNNSANQGKNPRKRLNFN